MAKAMVMTLGTGRDVEKGLARSIQTNNPDKLCFLATRESLPTIHSIEAVLGQELAYEPPFLVDNAEDIEECWRITAQTLRSLIQAGYTASDICLDFTSGTKAMSAGAVLAAVSLEVGSLGYVGGGKRDALGRVVSGTERVIILTPNEVFIDQHRRLIRDFFNSFQYDACLKLINESRTKITSEELHHELAHLQSLVYAYSWWDKFDHQKAASYFQQIPGEFDGRWRINTSQSKEMVFRIARQRQTYEATEKITDKYSEEILADLLANAERRAREGKHDDAVARLYRVVEVIAQALLARRGVDTSEVNPDALPPTWRQNYQKVEEPIKLGQEKAFALLEDLGEKTGREYLQNKSLRNYLSKRNSSILAHGLEPLTGEIYEALAGEVRQIAFRGFPHLNSLLEKSRFPALELS